MTSSLVGLACLVTAASAFLLGDATTPPAAPLELTYFDLSGRAEVSRLLFAAAKQNFVDIRVQFKDWPALKPTTPYGHLPLLNVSGVIYTQSLAIQNYIARMNGLYPASPLDQLMCDQISFAREDLLIATRSAMSAADPVAANQTLIQTTMPLYLGNFNRYIKENVANSGYAIGSKLSLADIVIFEGTEWINRAAPTLLDAYPEIKALRATVAVTDGVKQYLAQRSWP